MQKTLSEWGGVVRDPDVRNRVPGEQKGNNLMSVTSRLLGHTSPSKKGGEDFWGTKKQTASETLPRLLSGEHN